MNIQDDRHEFKMVTSGARSAERVHFYIPEKSQYERPAGRPAGRPLILTFLRYIEVDSLRASRSARNHLKFIKHQAVTTAGRPAVVTLFERLFLWNGMTNSRTVILIRCHHPINHVFDRYRYPAVPATARGTCRGEGVEDTLSLGNSTTAGPIAFKFGV